jgi:predicted metal-dependent hydrolase
LAITQKNSNFAAKIRNMKTRWGVCNVKTHKVTLNLELIKKDLIYLDYVIVHELSHLLHANHSKAFWQCVEDNFKDYKKIRKELKEDE